MSGIIETILSVAEALFGLRGNLAKAKQERKEAVAGFLGEIAQLIEETSALLAQGTYPHGKCQELLMHAQHMEQAIGDLIGTLEAKNLGSQLEEVYEIERLYGEIQAENEEQRKRKLSVLDQAAGIFRATAAFVRVSP